MCYLHLLTFLFLLIYTVSIKGVANHVSPQIPVFVAFNKLWLIFMSPKPWPLFPYSSLLGRFCAVFVSPSSLQFVLWVSKLPKTFPRHLPMDFFDVLQMCPFCFYFLEKFVIAYMSTPCYSQYRSVGQNFGCLSLFQRICSSIHWMTTFS